MSKGEARCESCGNEIPDAVTVAILVGDSSGDDVYCPACAFSYLLANSVPPDGRAHSVREGGRDG